MAINTSLPTRLLLDNDILPSYKVLYCILDHLSNELGEVHYNRNKFIELLTFNSETGPKSLSVEAVEGAIAYLEEKGYIAVDKATIFMYSNAIVRTKEPSKGTAISEDAKEVKAYHSSSSMIRGYTKRASNSRSDMEIIQRYLNQGYTKEDLIGYINHHFQREYIRKNPIYSSISTAFTKTAFEREYPFMENTEGIRDLVITPYGLEGKTGVGGDNEWM